MVRWPPFFKHAHVRHHSVSDSVGDAGRGGRGQGQDAAVITFLMCGNVRPEVVLAQGVYTGCVFAHVKLLYDIIFKVMKILNWQIPVSCCCC